MSDKLDKLQAELLILEAQHEAAQKAANVAIEAGRKEAKKIVAEMWDLVTHTHRQAFEAQLQSDDYAAQNNTPMAHIFDLLADVFQAQSRGMARDIERSETI